MMQDDGPRERPSGPGLDYGGLGTVASLLLLLTLVLWCRLFIVFLLIARFANTKEFAHSRAQ